MKPLSARPRLRWIGRSLEKPSPEVANRQLQPQAQAQVGLRYNVAVHP